MPGPHVEAILAHDSVPPTLREAVRRTGVSVSFRPLSDALRTGLSAIADAFVIVGGTDAQALDRPLRVLLQRIADRPRGVLVLRPDGAGTGRFTYPETVPVSFCSGSDADEVAIRLSTVLDARRSLECLHRGLVANRQMEENAAKLYEGQLRLASQVQREFIPQPPPKLERVSFSALFRPAEYVSGDIYDIHRLDEDHVALAVADASGHGIPAALLTVFIKRALRGKEVQNGSYRIVPPDEVLSHLNEELLETSLSECRFVAATYAVLNIRTLVVSLARGGAPYPVLRRRDGTLRLVRPAGGVIGVLPGARYEAESIQLEPGDSLVVYSDGLESVVLPQLSAHALAEAFSRAAAMVGVGRATGQAARQKFAPESQPAGAAATAVRSSARRTAVRRPSRPPVDPRGPDPDGTDSRAADVRAQLDKIDAALKKRGFAPDEALLASAWCATLREAGAAAALEQLAIRYDSLRRMGHPVDDLTVLALSVDSV